MVGVRGSAEDCRVILEKVRNFLKSDLLLDLSETKTLITNIGMEYASFLGVRVKRAESEVCVRRIGGKNIARNAKSLRFIAPIDLCLKKLKTAGFISKEASSPKFR